MDSKRLKVPVSESDKLEVSVLGCRFGEKAEHLPIKKRRFLYRASSPPRNTTSSEGTETAASCLESSNQEVQPKPDASCLPAASSTDADLHQTGSDDGKVDGKELVKAKASEDEDICGIPLAAVAEGGNSLGGDVPAESLEAPITVKSKETIVKSANTSAEETDSHISTSPFKDVASSITDRSFPDKATLDNSTPDESTLDNSCSLNQVTSKTEKSSARDERLRWDLNTVMDAWEEPLECNNITYVKEEKSSFKEGNSEGSELGRECLSASENISNKTLPVDLKSLGHIIEDSKLEERKPSCADISKLLSPVLDGALDSSLDAIPAAVHSTLTLQYPACDIPAKHINVNCEGTDDLSCSMAANTGFSLDYSVPPGFNHSVNTCSAKESVDVSSTIVGSGSNISHPVTTVETVIKSEKHDLSLATVASLGNEIHQSGSTFNEDDKAKVKKVICSNGTDLPQETDKADCNAVNPTTFASPVTQSSVVAEVADQPAVVSSIKAEPLSLTETSTIYHIAHESHTICSNDLVSCNKEACEVPLGNGSGNENLQSDIQAGSEVDNVDEVSFGYDVPYEDGELRDSSIQTWDDKENEHGMQNIGTSLNLDTLDAHENNSQWVREDSSTGSQRGADEISSVLLPEKLDGSDQVSGSGPDETSDGTRQVITKDTNETNQWKMNVSGWDLLPEDQNTSNNVANIRDLSSIKFSSRIQRYGLESKDVETKAECSRFYKRESNSRIGGPAPRDAFLNRGRLRMQGSSSGGADDSNSRPIREPNALRSVRRGKYNPYIPTNGRGGGMWNRSRSPPHHLHSPSHHGPSFRRSMLEDVASVDNLTNEVNVNPNINRQSFRPRLPTNREEDDFRARLGLRPSGETNRNRLVSVGRGRLLKYTPRHNEAGPTGRVRYRGPESDDYNEPLMEYKYSHPFQRRDNDNNNNNNHPCAPYRSGSISPPRSRTHSPIIDGFRHHTSRSPTFRSDARMRRPRSPIYQTGFEAESASEYNIEPRNNNFNYKQRRSPPPGRTRIDPIYDSLRKTKQNENYGFGHPGRFVELHGAGLGGPGYGDVTDTGYRHGGFVRRYDMGRPVKHFRYHEEDGYGPVYDSNDKDGLEFHGRGNGKAYSNGMEGRFRDVPRRPREERENW